MFTSMLDVNKLQENVDRICEKEGMPRGCGRTTALLYLLLGDVELGDAGNTYMFVSNSIHTSKRVQTLFLDMLHDHNLEFDYHQSFGRFVLANDTTVFFISLSQFLTLDAFRGVKIDRVFLDVSYELLCKEDNTGSLDYPVSYLLSRGADFV